MKKFAEPLIAILLATCLVVVYVVFRVWQMRHPELTAGSPFLRDDSQILPRIVVAIFIGTVLLSTLWIFHRAKWIARYQAWIAGSSSVGRIRFLLLALAVLALMKYLRDQSGG